MFPQVGLHTFKSFPFKNWGIPREKKFLKKQKGGRTLKVQKANGDVYVLENKANSNWQASYINPKSAVEFQELEF